MRFLLIVGFLGMRFWAMAQTDRQDSPVFNSVELEEVAYEGFSITSGYYTIANNIDNRQSSAFISDAPSLEEYIYFARHQPSYYFLVHRQREVIRMIILQQQVRSEQSQFSYTVINPASGLRTQMPSQLSGELTQLRAKELTMSQVDPSAQQLNSETDAWCLFNQVRYPVQSFEAVRQEVVALAQQLVGKTRSQTEELKEYIRTETIGGTLDFEVALAKEPRQYFSRDGVVYNKSNFSVLLWGGAVRMLGMPSVENAMLLWEEIQQRPLTRPESQALKEGFAEEVLPK